MLSLFSSLRVGCFTPVVMQNGLQALHPPPVGVRGCLSGRVRGQDPVYGYGTRGSRRGIYSVSLESPVDPAAESPLITVSFSHGLYRKMLITSRSRGCAKGSLILFYFFMNLKTFTISVFCFFLNIINFLGRSFRVLEGCPCRKQRLVAGAGLVLKSS